jgi:hypothetical protein
MTDITLHYITARYVVMLMIVWSYRNNAEFNLIREAAAKAALENSISVSDTKPLMPMKSHIILNKSNMEEDGGAGPLAVPSIEKRALSKKSSWEKSRASS